MPLLDVIRDLAGIELRRQGRHWFARCPFHAGGNERTPSLSVSPDGNLWHCFSCGEGGDAVSFIAKLRGLRPIEAARMICSAFGLPVDDDDPAENARLKAEAAARKRRLAALNAGWRLAWAAASSYYRAAQTANEATDYSDVVLMQLELEASLLLDKLESPDPAVRLRAVQEVVGDV